MNPHDITADHRLTWDAIPWVLNGTASEAQQRLVLSHTTACADCRAELARQRDLQTAVAHDTQPVNDAEAGFARLMKRIDTAQHQGAAPGPRAVHPGSPRRSARPVVYWLAAAVIVEAVGISVLGAGLLWRANPAQAPYQTLSQAPAPDAKATIRIVPTAALTLGELQQTLSRLDLQVVAGPNTAGAYALAPRSLRFDTQTQVTALRAASGIRFAEPIALTESQP